MPADLGEVQLGFEIASKIQSTNAWDTDPDPVPLSISIFSVCQITHMCAHM